MIFTFTFLLKFPLSSPFVLTVLPQFIEFVYSQPPGHPVTAFLTGLVLDFDWTTATPWLFSFFTPIVIDLMLFLESESCCVTLFRQGYVVEQITVTEV